jgi:hypothetical protein
VSTSSKSHQGELRQNAGPERLKRNVFTSTESHRSGEVGYTPH